MKAAMILCAGFGTRLDEYTKNTPKPMLSIKGKPILEYTIEHLARLGITDSGINVHYLAKQITSYFTDGSQWGVTISYSYEEKPLGTAGGVKKVENKLGTFNEFLVLYGDVVTNQDFLDLFAFHCTRPNAIASIILHERNTSNSVVEMDSKNRIIRFIERPRTKVKDKKQKWVNSGLYCFNKKILNYLPPGQYCDFPKDIFPKLVSEGALYGYPLDGYRCAIDSPERYLRLQNDFEKENIF